MFEEHLSIIPIDANVPYVKQCYVYNYFICCDACCIGTLTMPQIYSLTGKSMHSLGNPQIALLARLNEHIN